MQDLNKYTRRFNSIIEFDHPDAPERLQLWRSYSPRVAEHKTKNYLLLLSLQKKDDSRSLSLPRPLSISRLISLA